MRWPSFRKKSAVSAARRDLLAAKKQLDAVVESMASLPPPVAQAEVPEVDLAALPNPLPKPQRVEVFEGTLQSFNRYADGRLLEDDRLYEDDR